MKLSEIGEDRFLEKLETSVPKPGPSVTLGIGDDAAALAIPDGESALLSTDVLVEQVHFTRRTLPPRFIGRKAVAVNVSDIAAMGGRPIGVLLALTVAPETEVEELLELFSGVLDRCRDLEIDLVGGNLSSSPGPMMVSVSILGASLSGNLLTRSGARPGDAIYVSGKLGAAAEGWELLKAGMAVSASGAPLVPNRLRAGPVPLAEACLRSHMDPEPRVELGRFLSKEGVASACIDISDGLTLDLLRLCRRSAVGARIEEASLPIHPGVFAWERVMGRPPLERAISGGEDYELLFTTGNAKGLDLWPHSEAVPVTRIGTVTDEHEGVRLILRDGAERELTTGGWDHFQIRTSPS